jgi:prolipoprotein diacylglyceryltransferase
MPPSPLKTGITLLGAGIFVFVLDYFRHYNHSSYLATHIGGYIFSGLFILLGLGFIVYGAFLEKNK